MMLVLVRVTESSFSPLRFRLINKTFLLILLTYWAVAKWIDVCDLLGSFSAVTRPPPRSFLLHSWLSVAAPVTC